MNPEEIKNLRELFKCNQEEFAKILGVTVATLSRWENASSMPSNTNVEQLEYLKKKLSEKDSDPDKLKNMLLVTGVAFGLGAALAPVALMMSGMVNPDDIIKKIKNFFS